MTVTAHLMLGLTASGKSSYCRKIAAQLRIPKLSLDEEYFKIVPNHQQEQRDFAIETEIEKDILARLVAFFNLQQSVALDFCPWLKHQRIEFYNFLQSNGATPRLYFLDAPK